MGKRPGIRVEKPVPGRLSRLLGPQRAQTLKNC